MMHREHFEQDEQQEQHPPVKRRKVDRAAIHQFQNEMEHEGGPATTAAAGALVVS